MFLKMYSILKICLTRQHILALITIWVAGICILGYLIFSFDKSNGSFKKNNFVDLVNFSLGDTPPDTESPNANAAYVFINVNKKHFLTRYVATITSAENFSTADKIKNLQPENSFVEKISKKIKPQINSKDFFIKQAPEL